MKLHWQFSHARFHRLQTTLTDPGIDSKKIYGILERLVDAGSVCLKYKKFRVIYLQPECLMKQWLWTWKNGQKFIVKIDFFTL